LSIAIGQSVNWDDVSPDYRYDKSDAQTIKKILPHEGTGEAIKLFTHYAPRLSNYGYWFLLGTLWVNYSGRSDLELWKQLFSSKRNNRETSLMKPSELQAYRELPDPLTVYRAHRPGEQDWISYTLSTDTVAMFALQRGIRKVSEHQVSKNDVLCLFLRRGEFEVLVLDKAKARFIQEIPLVTEQELEAERNKQSRSNESLPRETEHR
jgi:hypothetical protein